MKKTKVLVFGASGLIGSRFVEQSRSFELITPGSDELDITNSHSVTKIVDQHNPDWIINFTEFSDIDTAEQESGDTLGQAWKINVEGVQNILNAFKSTNIIQMSTDKVFPGNLDNPGPYSETKTPPETNEELTWYGWTKNRAEKLIYGREGAVLRISLPVRFNFADDTDYIRENLQQFAAGELSPLFHDQQIAISFVDEIVTALQKIIETDSHAVFHASSDTTTPHELISFVIKQLGEDETRVKSTSIYDFPAAQKNSNKYPVWGGLKVKFTEEALDVHFSTWQTVVEYLVGQGLRLPEKS
jgi:dTDP-4-dehydrorhamnose reductase